MKIKAMAQIGLISAIYVVLTLVISPLSYGPLQFRLGELLKPLALRGRKYVVALVLGVFIANLFSPFVGPWELIAMPLACLIGGEIAYRLRGNPILALSSYAVIVALAVGSMLAIVAGVPFWATASWVAISELILMHMGHHIDAHLLRFTE